MKKLSVLGVCLFAGLTAVAQNSLVKEVERELKSGIEQYPQKIEKLKPAFTDAETKDRPYVWYVAGKGGMDYFDNQEVLKQMGKPVDDQIIGTSLMNSFDYLIKALPLDSIPNEKGKIKTKYSKDIIIPIPSLWVVPVHQPQASSIVHRTWTGNSFLPVLEILQSEPLRLFIN